MGKVMVVDGVGYKLVQEPYVSDDGKTYQAAAETKGGEYMIFWNVIGNLDEIEDESEACDWENPSHVRYLGLK